MTNLKLGDRTLTPLWPDRPVVIDSLKPGTPPILSFDCTIRLEDCGQRLPYRLAQLTPLPSAPAPSHDLDPHSPRTHESTYRSGQAPTGDVHRG